MGSRGGGGHLLNSGLDNVPPSADGEPFIYKKIHGALIGQFRLGSLSAIGGAGSETKNLCAVEDWGGIGKIFERD